MARRSSRCEHFNEPCIQRPGFGLGGARGGDLAGAAPSGAPRSDPQAGQFAKRASFTRSVKEQGPRSTGTGKGRRVLQPASPA
jgi:hypothetical protein